MVPNWHTRPRHRGQLRARTAADDYANDPDVAVRFIGSLCALVACVLGTTHLSGREADPPAAVTPAGVDEGAPTAPRWFADAPVDEMLHTARGRWERWTEVPELVVLTSVMDFQGRGAQEYRATDERLRDRDV